MARIWVDRAGSALPVDAARAAPPASRAKGLFLRWRRRWRSPAANARTARACLNPQSTQLWTIRSDSRSHIIISSGRPLSTRRAVVKEKNQLAGCLLSCLSDETLCENI
jgi:hypothetical protein